MTAFDRDWTLFLDRDGVINQRIAGDFVMTVEELKYLPGVTRSLVQLCEYFKYVFIVTNQRCVDEGWITKNTLHNIHQKIENDVIQLGAKITKIYYCPHTKESNCDCRKPKTGMALQAQSDFPDVNFKKSIIVGDSLTDLEFGRQLGMKTVYIWEKDSEEPKALADFAFSSLQDFTTSIIYPK